MSHLASPSAWEYGTIDDAGIMSTYEEITRIYEHVELESIHPHEALVPDRFERLEKLYPSPREPRSRRAIKTNGRLDESARPPWIPATATWSEGQHVVLSFGLPGVGAVTVRVRFVDEALEVRFETPSADA